MVDWNVPLPRLIQKSCIYLLSYSIVHCHIMANVQFCKTCVSVIDKVQRHMHIFTRSKCHRQAILSQVLLSHWFQLSIQLNFPSLLPYSGNFGGEFILVDWRF